MNCDRPAASRTHRPGLSLLEVILALAILGVACTVMMQAMQVTVINALKAQRQAEGEICAESVLSQIVAGAIAMQPSSTWTPVGISASTSKWSYMIVQVNAESQNMVGIELRLRDMTSRDNDSRADLSVIRWIIDPALGLDKPPSKDQAATSQAGGGAASSGNGSSTTGGWRGKL